MGNGFIDIHCHILPGLDDGPSEMAQTMEMLRIAGEDGIECIVASPHVKTGVYENSRQAIADAVKKVNCEAKASVIPSPAGMVTVYPGADVYITRDLVDNARSGNLPLINDGNYLLLELPAYVLPPIAEVEKIIAGLRINGVIPLITHPERNLAILENISLVLKLIKAGAVCQLTGGSITGKFGGAVQKACFKMIKKGMVHAVASDAHDTVRRPPVLSEAHSMVAEKFGLSMARDLFIMNPLRILNGEPLAADSGRY